MCQLNLIGHDTGQVGLGFRTEMAYALCSHVTDVKWDGAGGQTCAMT